MAAKLQCEICGGKLIGKPGGIFECDSCGMEYSTAWAKEKIQEITGTVKIEGTVEVTGRVQIDNSANKEALLKRGMMALQDCDWEQAKAFFNQALNYDAQCAEAYLGLVMAQIQCSSKEEFQRRYVAADSMIRLMGNDNLTRVRQFSSDLASWLLQLDEQGTLEDQAARKREKDETLRLHPIREKLRPFTRMIAAGKSHTVGLKSDGTVVAIGDNYDGQCEINEWTDIIAIAAGESHTVGLKSDGTVVAVGNNHFNQCEVSDWTNIVGISAGDYVTMGLKSDGTVIVSDYPHWITLNWTDIIDIVAGSDYGGNSYCVGLKRDGNIVFDQRDSHFLFYYSPDWTDVVAISADEQHVFGLKSDGTIDSISDGMFEYDFRRWRDIVAIAAGKKHIVGLKADGSAVALGYNRDGFPDKPSYCEVSNWKDIVAVAAGPEHTVGLRKDGTVIAVGNNKKKQCDVSNWKLYQDYNNLEAERRTATERVEAKRRAERQAHINALTDEQRSLNVELANMKGLFTGSRRKEINTRLLEIEKEMKKLK